MSENKKYMCFSFVLNFIGALISIGSVMLLHHGIFSLRADYNEQMLPFAMNANELIKEGNIYWASCMDLGSDFIGAYSYYNLGSPFFWLSLMFPAKYFIYLAGWMFMLKYAVAGMTSYLFIERYVKDKRYAVMGSVLYAFSGFQSINLLFYMFHDVTALFPLLLIGIDDLVNNQKKGVFAFTVFLNALLNYFFFIGEVIFLILYFICRYWNGKIKIVLNNMLQCMVEGVLGVGMAAGLFVPSILFILQNPRVSVKMSLSEAIHYDLIRYLTILRAFIFPGEMMSDQSTLSKIDWTSTSAYLPMVGVILVILFISKNRRHWITKLLLVSFVFCIVPVFNRSFTLWTSDYSRWFYMPILLMALASAMVCEEHEKYRIIWASAAVAALLLLFIIGGIAVNKAGLSWKVILRPQVFAVQCIIAFAGLLSTWIIFRLGARRTAELMLAGVMSFAVFTTVWTIWLYRENQESPEMLYNRIEAAANITNDESGYRYTNKDNTLMIAANHKGSGTFSTTVNGSIFEFYNRLGLKRINNSPDGPKGINQLLSAKYTVLEKDDGTLTVSNNKAIGRIGFTLDTYITETEYKKIPLEDRAEKMLSSLVVRNEDAGKVSDILDYGKDTTLSVHSTEYSDDGGNIRSVITTAKECYAFYSIPYDKGWIASVNGRRTEILDINGMMAVRMEKGRNEVSFVHHTYGIYGGILISVISWVLYFFSICRRSKNGRRIQ